MTQSIPPSPPSHFEKYLESADPAEVVRKLRDTPPESLMEKTQWPELAKKFREIRIERVAPFAARYLQPIQNALIRWGAPSALTATVGTLATPVSALSAGELAGPIGLAAVGGLLAGSAANDLIPKGGDWLGNFAADLFGPAASDSWIWKLDGTFTRAFDSKKTIGDTLAKGLEAVAGSPSNTTMSVLDHLGFGGWEAFKKAWD
ncbi:MAG: hypothetical protein K8R69_03785 [Deltaproteobacteria bacterium]|nr:hypothetical protein [Deltaproteobacteria bacterium]